MTNTYRDNFGVRRRMRWTVEDQNRLRATRGVAQVVEAHEAHVPDREITLQDHKEAAQRAHTVRHGRAEDMGPAGPETLAELTQAAQATHPEMDTPSFDMSQPGTPEFMERVQPPEAVLDVFSMDVPEDFETLSAPERKAFGPEIVQTTCLRRVDSASGETLDRDLTLQDVKADDGELADTINRRRGVTEFRDPEWVGSSGSGSEPG